MIGRARSEPSDARRARRLRAAAALAGGAALAAFAWAVLARSEVRTALDGSGAPVGSRPAARFEVDCRALARAISPLIYGIGTYYQDEAPHQWALGATIRRWGGNHSSRYNWELGNAWNLDADYFFRNFKMNPRPGFTYDTFLGENFEHGMKSALTIPTLGWVAKDTTSYSFPVSVFGPQQATAWDLPDSGNGVGRDGKPIRPPPPTQTSKPAPPESIERWVRAIREKDRVRGRGVHMYILDNEPMLWHRTHRDVHPNPATYDELLERTIAYASAVRRADPDAVIAAPAEWGWLTWHFSAKDVTTGVRLRPDRLLHGNQPLIPWWLSKIREHEQKTGTRLLDILDVHFYPEAPGVGGGATDPATAALRIRSTRSLWDPSYVDESWIRERMRVLPLLREWVARHHPGLGLSIGEWNFGGENHMSGGLATAEALGRFGTEGVTSAFYWTYPPDTSPVFWAFRAYRNFDGSGGRFLDVSIPVHADAPLASLFASRDEEGRHVVAVLLNFDPERPLAADVEVGSCGAVTTARAFTYVGDPAGFRAATVAPRASGVAARVEPYTITVLDLTIASEPRSAEAPATPGASSGIPGTGVPGPARAR